MKNSRFQKLVAPGMRLYLIIMIIFAAATFFINEKLAMVEGAIILILIIYSLVDARQRRKRLVAYSAQLLIQLSLHRLKAYKRNVHCFSSFSRTNARKSS